MAIKLRRKIKEKFSALKKPKEKDFSDWIDSFFHKWDEKLEIKKFDQPDFKTTITLDANLGDLEIGGNATRGALKLKNFVGADTISLNGENGSIVAGKNGVYGDVMLYDRNDNWKVTLRADYSTLFLSDSHSKESITLDGSTGSIYIYDSNDDESRAAVLLRNYEGNGLAFLGGENGHTIKLGGGNGSIEAGKNGAHGKISLYDRNDNRKVYLRADYSTLFLSDSHSKESITLDGSTGSIYIYDSNDDESRAAVLLRNYEGNGLAFLGGENGHTIKLDGGYGQIVAGKNGGYGDVTLYDGNDNRKVYLRADYSTLFLSDSHSEESITLDGHMGSIYIYDSNSEESRVAVLLRNYEGDGYISLKNSEAQTTIKLHGKEEGSIWVKGGLFADFVFGGGYTLMPIKNVNSFIQKNKHLPDIPSAQEIKENGLNLTDFSLKLLQKIEELTLYVIDLQEQINELKTKK